MVQYSVDILPAGVSDINAYISSLALSMDRESLERVCLELQRRQPDFAERNRRLIKAGKIDFDDYVEL